MHFMISVKYDISFDHMESPETTTNGYIPFQ